MRFKKTALMAGVCALAMSLALVGCSSTSSSTDSSSSTDDTASQTESIDVTVGLYSGSYLSVPVLVAKDKGYFAEEGLNVTWEDVNGDGTAMIATGDLDFYNTGYSSVLSGVAQGEESITIIGGEMSEGCDYVVRSDYAADSISSPSDFAGLKIAVCVGDPGYYMTQAVLANAGVQAEFVEFSSIDETITALTKGEVDLSIVCGAMSYNAIQDGCKVLAKVSDITGTFPCCRIQVSTQLLEENPDAAVRYMKAALRGYADYVNDPDGTSEILANVSGQDAETVKIRMYGTDSYDTPMKVSIDPEANAVLNANDQFVVAGAVTASDVDLSKYINVDAYQQALTELSEEDPSNELWQKLLTDFQTNNSDVL